jgi:AcrR family transcriptional regulator
MPRRYSMDTRAALTAATRTRVIDATLQELAESGADGLTMQAVAERADVALRTLYNHFPTREELLSESLTRLLDEIRAASEAAVADERGSARERLLAFVDTYYRLYDAQGSSVSALMRVQGIAEVDRQVDEVRAWRKQQLARLLRAADAEAGLRLSVARATALAFALTAYATWSSLVHDAGLRPEAARAVARHAVERSVLA